MAVTAQGLQFLVGGSGQVQFTVTDGPDAPSIQNGAILPLVGNFAGAFVLQGALSRSGALVYFETGFQYGHATTGGSATQIYPALRTDAGLADIAYAGAVDPLDPFNSVKLLSAPGPADCARCLVSPGTAGSKAGSGTTSVIRSISSPWVGPTQSAAQRPGAEHWRSSHAETPGKPPSPRYI